MDLSTVETAGDLGNGPVVSVEGGVDQINEKTLWEHIRITCSFAVVFALLFRNFDVAQVGLETSRLFVRIHPASPRVCVEWQTADQTRSEIQSSSSSPRFFYSATTMLFSARHLFKWDAPPLCRLPARPRFRWRSVERRIESATSSFHSISSLSSARSIRHQKEREKGEKISGLVGCRRLPTTCAVAFSSKFRPRRVTMSFQIRLWIWARNSWQRMNVGKRV